MPFFSSLAAPLLPAPAAAADEPTLGVQVNRAVDKGVAWLKTVQNADGSFQGPYTQQYPVGQTALALYALSKSKVPADDPVVAKAIAYVRDHRPAYVYEAAVGILALDALKDPAHDDWIRTRARWIESHVDAKLGVWGYPSPQTDISNTQFACLGLWAAEAHGYRAAPALWKRLLRVVPDLQAPWGAFRYSPNRAAREGSAAQTTAGLTVLLLALDRADIGEKDRTFVDRARRAIARGWEYLERRFAVESNPWGVYAYEDAWAYYWLYGLERVAALAGKAKIGSHDWYREGAQRLVATQNAAGWWGGTSPNTCFALLFLRKATATRMGADGPGTLEGEGVPEAPAASPPRPSASVPFVTRWLVLGPFPNADDSGLLKDDSAGPAAAPRANLRADKGAWTVCRSPFTYVSFRHALGAQDYSLSYAFTYLHAAKDADVVLWLGHHDGARVTLDGKTIHDTHVHGAFEADHWSVPVHLAAGPHRVLFKVEETWFGNGAWLRVAHADGSEAPEVVPSLSPEAPEPADALRLKPDAWSLADLLRMLPTDRSLNLDFDRSEDVDRVIVQRPWNGYPRWFSKTEAKADQPNPGRVGVLVVHPPAAGAAVSVIRKVRLPPTFPFLHLRVSGDPYDDPKQAADFVLRTSVFDGEVHPLSSQTIEAGKPSPDGWKTVDVDLRAYAGKDVLLVVEVAAGGELPWWNEEAFFDEMSVETALR